MGLGKSFVGMVVLGWISIVSISSAQDVCRLEDDNVYINAQSSVIHRWQDPIKCEVFHEEDLGGIALLPQHPSLHHLSVGFLRNEDGGLEVFVRGADDALWTKWQSCGDEYSGCWSEWTSLGGRFKDGLELAQWGSHGLKVTIYDVANGVLHYAYKTRANPWGAHWSAWQQVQ